jgi:hypothetical protein
VDFEASLTWKESSEDVLGAIIRTVITSDMASDVVGRPQSSIMGLVGMHFETSSAREVSSAYWLQVKFGTVTISDDARDVVGMV